MNKLIMMATIVAGVGMMLGFTGCGNDNSAGKPDYVAEFQSLQNKAIEMQLTEKKLADEEVAKFKKLEPEEQKKSIEKLKSEIGLK